MGAGWGNTQTRTEPALGLKKNLIPVPNSFIKFKPPPIRGGTGRVPEKTRPIAIPTQIMLTKKCIKEKM